MLAIVNVILPVFAVVGLGYLAVRFRLYPASGVPGLVAFVNNFATPFLLFRAMLTADFASAFNPAIIGPFYAGRYSRCWPAALSPGASLAIVPGNRFPRVFRRPFPTPC